MHRQQGAFSLDYDPLCDHAQVFYGTLLIAESPRADCWIVKHGRGWFEFECQPRRRKRFGGDLRGWLQHIRAMSGAATDVCSIAHRVLTSGQAASASQFDMESIR